MRHLFLTAAAAVLLTACGTRDNAHDAMGVFEATEITVSAKAQGELTSLRLEEGDLVRTHDTLGLIDVRQLNLERRRLSQHREANDARLLSLQTQIAATRQQIANARSEQARFEALVAQKAATRKQVDDLAHEVSVLEQQLKALTEQVETTNAATRSQGAAVGTQIEAVDVRLSDAVISSPVTGTILEKFAEPGEYATPGRPLFTVADLSVMTLRAYVTAEQYNGLRLGQEVKVCIDGREAPYKGKVAWISRKAEFTPKTILTRDERANLVYAVKIAVRNDGQLKIGMYGEVDL